MSEGPVPCSLCGAVDHFAIDHRWWRDRQGDVWTLGADGLMHTPETAPFPAEHVVRKWGPLMPVPQPSERESTGGIVPPHITDKIAGHEGDQP